MRCRSGFAGRPAQPDLRAVQPKRDLSRGIVGSWRRWLVRRWGFDGGVGDRAGVGGLLASGAGLVLRNNYLQSQAISTGEFQAKERLAESAYVIRALERSGDLNRSLEYLPSDEEIAEETDRRVSSLPPGRMSPGDPDSPVNALRADHRGEHLDEIESALGGKGESSTNGE